MGLFIFWSWSLYPPAPIPWLFHDDVEDKIIDKGKIIGEEKIIDDDKMVDNEMMKMKGGQSKCQIQYKGSITNYNASKGL